VAQKRCNADTVKIDPAEYRRVLGHFATGVTVVTTHDTDGRPAGLTANAFAAVSIDPPLVLVCIDRNAETHQLIESAGCFAINVLADSQEALARRFAEKDRERRFDGVAWREEATGAPVLAEVLAWIDCRVHARTEGGDHTIFIGEVAAADALEGAPLVFYRAGFGGLTP
jgi:flavin reductase (DIM6/NTAB) family NADH-FMN oxidoreductase RutF